MHILAVHLHHLLQYARLRGLSPEDILALVQSTPLDDLDEKTLIKADDLYRVIHAIDTQLPDSHWGIACGQCISLKLLGVIYQLSLQATTVDEALHYLQTYLEAAIPLIRATTRVSAEQVELCFVIDNNSINENRVLLEYTLAIVSRELQMMTGPETDIQLSSPYWEANYPAAWKKGEAFTVTFEPVILKAALRNNSHLQVDVLVPEYLRMIEQLKPDDSFAGKVKLALLSMSDPQLPDIQAVSGALYLTPRTLQRRLAAEGSSFRELLEEIKKKLCGLLLRHDRYTVAGIATILGYSEPAAFIHSFRKWYGDSPDRLRRLL
ncbi:AraC family transcriptional regulator [Paraflavitalea pollutisoli]|uniref:AraC family transcriptional regulator n=1 Tax=Paraflavitalea pollutisoli TaxID=3034143 RepID=UPI0023EB43A1|nr:AraC family transcriptional regulator [Paraflavitalea sp. H1-2-19X]